MRHRLAVLALLSVSMPLGAITHIRQLLNVAGPGSAPATGYVLIQANRPFRTAGGVAVTTTVFRYDIPTSGANTGYLDVNLQPTIGSTATGTTTAPLGYVAEYHTNGIVYRDFWSVPDTGTTLDLSGVQVNALPATPFALNINQLTPIGSNGYALEVIGGVVQWGPQSPPTFLTVPYSATPVFDLSVATAFKITLTGNVTNQTFPNVLAGQTITITICQDPAGNHTFAWAARVHGGFGVGLIASKCSTQDFTSDGDQIYAKGLINQ